LYNHAVRARPSSGAILAAMPDLALAATYLITWVSPQAFGASPMRYLTLVMLMEFISIHSSAVLGAVVYRPGPPRRKALAIVGLGAFYTLFVGVYALSFGEWWPVVAFWGLILNRLSNVMLGRVPDGRERNLLQISWGVSVAAYVGCVTLTNVLPLPQLGWAHVAGAGAAIPGAGHRADEPSRLLAAGFTYFTIQSLWDLFGERWVARRADASANITH